jgi:hypothetical protein
MAQQQSIGIGSGVIPNWLWDPGIHLTGRLLWIVVMTRRAMTVFGLLYFSNASRGGVETYLIWKDKFSLLISRIETDSGFADLGFTEIPLQVNILDSEFSSYRSFIVEFQERRT